jgi:hypothetical protein
MVDLDREKAVIEISKGCSYKKHKPNRGRSSELKFGLRNSFYIRQNPTPLQEQGKEGFLKQ